jgi:hypothetical protein
MALGGSFCYVADEEYSQLLPLLRSEKRSSQKLIANRVMHDPCREKRGQVHESTGNDHR